MHTILYTHIQTALHEAFGIFSASFTVEHPADASHGDYATNVALVVAKEAGKSPREVAETLVAALHRAVPQHIVAITIAGPGFINFTLDRAYFSEQIGDILAHDDAWGKPVQGSEGFLGHEEILFEYTSPNLFKPLHVGNLVGNIIGESLARLYAFSGARVVRINYPSDIGLTVAKGVWALREFDLNADEITTLGEAYRRGNEAYEADPEAKTAIEAVNRALYAGSDATLAELRTRGITTSRRALDALLAMLGTSFDETIFESEVEAPGAALVRAHLADGIFTESNGALVYEGERAGLHTRVFVNSQGLPTYEAKDLGNFSAKVTRHPSWTRMVIVTGGEQREYFKVIFAAAREIFPEAAGRILAHIPTGFLTLTTGKMSSRRGNVLTAEDIFADLRAESLARAAESRADDTTTLADRIAVAALKYQILRQATGSDIVFDKQRALSFEGATGPYLLYTYARCVSVQEKAHAAGIVAGVDIAPAESYALERVLYRFPEIVALASGESSPHHLATYLTDLAAAFNSFYTTEKIADPTDTYASYKTALTYAVAATLRTGLYLLGIETVEQM